MDKTTKIVDSAIRLFMNSDIRKVTMDEIAAKANVSKMTVYKYFGDKDSLYYHVGEAILNRLYTTIKNETDTDVNPNEKIRRTIEHMREFIIQGYRAAAMELARLNDQFDSEYTFIENQIKYLIMAMLKEGLKDGSIRSDLSADFCYHSIRMELFYFQFDEEYRGKWTHDTGFRTEMEKGLIELIFCDQLQCVTGE